GRSAGRLRRARYDDIGRTRQAGAVRICPGTGGRRVMTKLEAEQEVEGKVALVTGGTGGIGAALEEALLAAGAARVIVAARNTRDDDHGRRCTRQLDVTSAESVARLAAEFGNEVDILINNA